jgi:hypothetical protein
MILQILIYKTDTLKSHHFKIMFNEDNFNIEFLFYGTVSRILFKRSEICYIYTLKVTLMKSVEQK